jgi:hypothetical protein
MSVETDHKLICGDLIRKDNPLMAIEKHLTPIDIQLLSDDSHPMAFASVLI